MVIAAPGNVVPNPINAAPSTCAATVNGLTAKLQCTPAVALTNLGVPLRISATTTYATTESNDSCTATPHACPSGNRVFP